MLEQELKLTAKDPSVLQEIVQSQLITKWLVAPPQERKRYLARYHDSVDRLLYENSCSLRSRLEGEHFRAAFKEKGEIVDGLSSRVELECDISGWLSNVSDLPECELKHRVVSLLGSEMALETPVMVDMMRTVYLLCVGESAVECVTDVGTIQGAGQTVFLSELELELKQGAVDSIKSLGAQLRHQFEVEYSTTTKHQIGLALLENTIE